MAEFVPGATDVALEYGGNIKNYLDITTQVHRGFVPLKCSGKNVIAVVTIPERSEVWTRASVDDGGLVFQFMPRSFGSYKISKEYAKCTSLLPSYKSYDGTTTKGSFYQKREPAQQFLDRYEDDE